jgi:hypothetical protein
MRLFLLLSLPLFLAACSPEPAERPPDEDPPAVRDASEQEEFAEFFSRFRSDLEFQQTRVATPLTYRYIDFDSEHPEEVEETMAWEPQTLGWEGGEATEERFNDQPDPGAVAADANEVTYQIAGLDSGINVQYTFTRTDGRWHLTEVADMST